MHFSGWKRHSRTVLATIGGAVAGAVLTGPLLVSAAPPLDRVWLLWEQLYQPTCPANTTCLPQRRYTTRLIDEVEPRELERAIGMLDRVAMQRGLPIEHPESPRICQEYDAEVRMGFDPEALAMSEKLEPLRGIKGVYVDITGLQGPDGFSGDFGGGLQLELEKRFKAAGLQVYTEDEAEAAPGKPKMAVYFTAANNDTGCHYSVFASLTQTAVLTRDIEIKIRAGTWAASGGPSDKYPDDDEYATILRIIDNFVESWKSVNPTG